MLCGGIVVIIYIYLFVFGIAGWLAGRNRADTWVRHNYLRISCRAKSTSTHICVCVSVPFVYTNAFIYVCSYVLKYVYAHTSRAQRVTPDMMAFSIDAWSGGVCVSVCMRCLLMTASAAMMWWMLDATADRHHRPHRIDVLRFGCVCDRAQNRVFLSPVEDILCRIKPPPGASRERERERDRDTPTDTEMQMS